MTNIYKSLKILYTISFSYSAIFTNYLLYYFAKLQCVFYIYVYTYLLFKVKNIT